jgi:hypothetical protein
MTSDPSHRPVSALRARMIEDMSVRGFTEKTRRSTGFLAAIPIPVWGDGRDWWAGLRAD